MCIRDSSLLIDPKDWLNVFFKELNSSLKICSLLTGSGCLRYIKNTIAKKLARSMIIIKIVSNESIPILYNFIKFIYNIKNTFLFLAFLGNH